MSFSKEDNWGEAPSYARGGLTWYNATNNTECERIVYTSLNNGGIPISIRMNNFPDEPLYTLLEADKEIIHFNNWPENWMISK